MVLTPPEFAPPVVARIGALPLPRSKYPANAEFEGFAPAPLDEVSLWNGLGRFLHPQCTITPEESLFALSFLEALFPLLGRNSSMLNDQEILNVCFDPDHYSKTAGYPWFTMGAPTKGDALEKFGLEQIKEYYQNYTSVLGSTLKPEIRAVGKDARLFRPQDVSSFVEGATLFYHQNQYLMNLLHSSPIHCKFRTPGPDITRTYEDLYAFCGSCYSADGSAWDANFSLAVAALIGTFRSVNLDAERVNRYYSQMYNGYTNIGGNLFQIAAQPSGHYNTSVDNSLGHCICFAIHAYRNGVTLKELLHNVLFYCCGDDLIWSDRTGTFTPVCLSETYASLGIYLEFDALEPRCVYDLPFVGVEFHDRNIRGQTCKMYAIRSSKAKATFNLRKTKNDDLLELMKYTSLCQLTFGDETTYSLLKKATENFVVEACLRGTLSLMDPCVRGVLASMQPSVLEREYFHLEPFFVPGDGTLFPNVS